MSTESRYRKLRTSVWVRTETLKIAAGGKPYPVTLTDPEGAEVDPAFCAFGEPVGAKAPAAESVLTEDQLLDIRLAQR